MQPSDKKTQRSDKFPSKSEGKEGDRRFVQKGNSVYFCYKSSTSWFKIKMEKI